MSTQYFWALCKKIFCYSQEDTVSLLAQITGVAETSDIHVNTYRGRIHTQPLFMNEFNSRVGIYTPSHETAETNSSVFVETDYQRLDVKFRFRVTKGSLSTFPSDLVFEPAFPVRRAC